MTTSNSISAQVDTFVAGQNTNRGIQIGAGGVVQPDFNALTGGVPSGDNAVTGVAGITSTTSLNLGASGFNTVVFDGSNSIQTGVAGQPDNYAISVPSAGTIVVLDENTGKTMAISGATYLIFDGGAKSADGSYQLKIVAGGAFAQVALMYDAAFERQPDLPGLEYNAIPVLNGVFDLHQTAVDFLASHEFAQDYQALLQPSDNGGPNDVKFITELYGNILHRAPNATEIQFYVNALQGTLPGISTKADRANLLEFFSVSPENQHNSTWLINTDNGAYQDAGYALPGSQPATTVLSVGAGGTINTAAIDETTITGGSVSVNGGFGSGGITVNTGNTTIFSGEANVSIYLSTQIPNVNLINAAGDTIYGPSGGGSNVTYQLGGNTVHMSGTGNNLENANPAAFGLSNAPAHAAPVPLVVYGMATGDTLAFDYSAAGGSGGGPHSTQILATPAAGTTYHGNSFVNPTFGTTASPPPGYYFNNTTFVIEVGAVADNTAATMAAAASKVYTPTTNFTGATGEWIIFVGQGQSNDTVVYKWFADTSHTISAATMVGGLDLVGIAPSQIGNFL